MIVRLVGRLIVLASLITLSACDSDDNTQPSVNNDNAQNIPSGNEETAAGGVTTTASGLQYEVLREAEGESPGPNSVVTVHYLGTLTDGTKFDSSYDRGAPSTFNLRQVILGWTEGLQLMNVGSQYRLTIPPELGYGDRQNGDIPPDSTLVFEVELLEINS